ncbi:MAG: GTPase domain-containing protein [Candidatus Helarchaeota archaeon]
MIWSFFLILTELVNFQPTGKSIYSQKFGQLDDDTPLINKFISFIPTLEDYDSGSRPVGKIQFVYSGYNDLLFVLCADKTDDIMPLFKMLENLKIAFVQKYFPLIKEGKDDPASFKAFKTDVDTAFTAISEAKVPAIPTTASSTKEPAPSESTSEVLTSTIKKQMVKIAFIGAQGVGKRTVLNLLFTGTSNAGASVEESEMMMKKGPISEKYNALLLTMPNEMITSGKTQFLSNTDVAIFVTSSVFKDVMATRKIYEEVKTILPNAQFGVIANKQDTSGAVEPDAIRKVYDLPILPLVATDAANYDMLKMFVIELIEK